MPESAESKQTEQPGQPPGIPVKIPAPLPMGLCLLILAPAFCCAGLWRRELPLTLLGAILSAAGAYCFAGTLILSFLHRKGAGTLSSRMIPAELNAGQGGVIVCSRNQAGTGERGPRFFRLPGILIRYRVELSTRDGRRIIHTFDPDYQQDTPGEFPPPERGAYYGEHDRLCILDALGLFQTRFPVPQHRGERLLVLPRAAEEPVSLPPRAGGHEQRSEPHFQRTDDLIDHRPYVPGDDPRRINWKLYGHAGDLFIREGEPEPPPHSRLVMLLDTQADPLLYTPEAARCGVDLLCSQALALIREYAGRGIDILLGYTGGAIQGGGSGELAALLARPAALLPADMADLPDPPEDRNILLLALPRSSGEAALDRFLKKRGTKNETVVLFLYTGDWLDEAAETAALFYNRRGGIHARRIKF